MIISFGSGNSYKTALERRVPKFAPRTNAEHGQFQAIQTHEAAFGGLVRTTITYYTYIIRYSLGRKYTYNTENHPRIIFIGMYVPRGAFSQSFRALAAKDQKLWLLAD